ncbi:colorectal cancer associated 2 [Micropterus salmoides]|uniref:colorectal cancer associated 2 n=1 Tax=Micropterus salmoides TaxID=27706 RepID=UPI0018ED8291|nr:colorectal cancer associated 2 [Micropterus salmoides]
MSDKPRVYQGVRVKTTVKELLQRHRAREATSKKVKTMGLSQACLDLQDLCASTLPCRYVDPPPSIPPADASNCSARALHLRATLFPVPDSSCNFQMQESTFNDVPQHFEDLMLPSNGYSCNHNNNNNNGGGGGYDASPPPPPTFPLPWCHGRSSDADFYGHGMPPCSSPESLKLCNPIDHNSYSPQDSFSSSSSSCYDSPTRMESSYHGFASEHYHYQHCNLQDCYCLSHCWPGQQESFSGPEYAPYYNPTDYPYAGSVEENYFKRDVQMSSEMCNNVL